jgi:hypothetical protein
MAASQAKACATEGEKRTKIAGVKTGYRFVEVKKRFSLSGKSIGQ